MKSLRSFLLPVILVCALSAGAGVSRVPGMPETVILDNGLLKITFVEKPVENCPDFVCRITIPA